MNAHDRSTRVCLAAAIVGCVLVMPIGAADEPTASDLFDDRIVHELRLSMHSEDWTLLRLRFMENTFYPADLAWNGVVVRNVGVRSRGSGSRDPHKPSLKIDVDRFVADQLFAGMKAFDLDNFRQDAGMMKEPVTMQFFRKMGIAAPRAVHARVFVNNDYIGLYAVLETLDKRFLKSALDQNDGYLYEFEWANDFRMQWLGPDLSRYAGMFKPRTHETETPEMLFETIENMIEAVNRSPRDTWEQVVARFLDFETFLVYLAVEMFLSDNDGFVGDWGMNNFYLYRFEDSDRFQFIPWDKDFNFHDVEREAFAGFDANVLTATAMRYPRLRGAYVSALRRCAAIALEPAADGSGPGWLEREIAREAAMIRPSAYDDPTKAYTNERFEQEVAWMLDFARKRSGQIYRQVGER